MARFKVTSEQGMLIVNTEIEADYMEVGSNLVFKNRSANTCVAAFSDWLSVVQVEDANG